jgi:hypothetical protein
LLDHWGRESEKTKRNNGNERRKHGLLLEFEEKKREGGELAVSLMAGCS